MGSPFPERWGVGLIGGQNRTAPLADRFERVVGDEAHSVRMHRGMSRRRQLALVGREARAVWRQGRLSDPGSANAIVPRLRATTPTARGCLRNIVSKPPFTMGF